MFVWDGVSHNEGWAWIYYEAEDVLELLILLILILKDRNQQTKFFTFLEFKLSRQKLYYGTMDPYPHR